MIAFDRVLFPTDFSQQSAAVAPAVQAMAKRFGSEVTVLHVIDLPPNWYGAPEAAAWSALINAGRLRLEGGVALDRFVAAHFQEFPVTRALEEGDAACQIVDYARDHKIQLIMMPTRGHGPFRAALLGSVTAKVLHDAAVPVWTAVHAQQLTAHPAERWKRMLCALDTGSEDLAVLRWAAEFAAEQGLQLRLAHAVQGADGTFTEERDPSMYEFLCNTAREGIAKMQAEAGTNFEVCLRAGSAARVVHQAAIGHQADLVVIGRGVMHKTLGRLRTRAYSIIRHAPCPVISI